MANGMNAISNTRRERTWLWWAKWLFASWGFAVGSYILLIVILMPILDLPSVMDVLGDYRGLIMSMLFIFGGICCYQYLK